MNLFIFHSAKKKKHDIPGTTQKNTLAPILMSVLVWSPL